MGLWTLSIAFAIYRSIAERKQQYEENLKIVARISYEKDLLYRKWVSIHGGVYVPITKTFRPNPHLSFIKNRDVITINGDSLTLVNPAFMTRQIYELGKDEYGAIGHLSSLKPINSFNAPNKSEKQALLRFEKGDTLFVTNDTINREVFYTYVRPFITELNCLKCHAQQGYKVGDIRGALFTAVPTKEFLQMKNEEIKSSLKSFLFIWFIGSGLILLVMYNLQKQVKARKIADETIVQRNTALRQLNIDKDRFISILGHDLKNPFNNILGFSEILTGEIEKLNKEEIKDIAGNINKSANITNNLLEDILMWARVQNGNLVFQPHILCLEDIFKNVIEVLRPGAYAKGITISFSNPDQINAYADKDMLKTILLNLVSNAIKFTNNGGAININAQGNPENLIISVSDNGIGMQKEDLSKLFNISEVITTKGTANETGTGLGLLLCKDFVEKHGGKIWVESEFGKGSDFKFTLPFNAETDKVNVAKNVV